MVRLSPSAGVFCLVVFGYVSLWPQNVRTPEQTARPIVERVIRKTSFAFDTIPQKPVLDIQVVDFADLFGYKRDGIAFAASEIWSPIDTSVVFGLSYDMPLSIRLNDEIIFSQHKAPAFYFREIEYGLFSFNDTIRFRLKTGRNPILIKALLGGERNCCYLRELSSPEQRSSFRFALPREAKSVSRTSWMYSGAYDVGTDPPLESRLPPERNMTDEYAYRGMQFKWMVRPDHWLKELRIDPRASFQRESFAEWQYPTGTLMLSLLAFADAEHDSLPAHFVQSYCSFTLDNLGLFKMQYDKLHAFRGADHGLIRRGMLDDVGAPTLPFAELWLRTQDQRFDSLLVDMIGYISKEQRRLPDGTFCRYTPEPGAVWADDLFMSAPLLVRMGILKNDSTYYNDAALQVINFHKYLEDTVTGLYRHGWYHNRRIQSPISWGRANGWVVWATSEVLKYLPITHRMRPTIVEIYRHHLESIVHYQAPSGLWHQVLDRADSFEETSCTAMFIIGMARGLQLGVLDTTFRVPLEKAWAGLQSRVSKDGIVKDICRGTGIGANYEFYAGRERFDNDPRGLGAVITACVEMMGYQRDSKSR